MANIDNRPMTVEERKVIIASSLGTVFEWYDFYLYGALAAIIAKQFFTGLDENSAFIFALLAFAAGFVVRPFGALVFGRLGDMIGRKYTFMITIMFMGSATFLMGVLPNYASIGVAAPIGLICLRMLQGLALGGEYGGAATYVAEHSPPGKRGAYTAWIQTTASMGLFLALMVILSTRTLVGETAFAAWGWRIPFLVSILLLAVSMWIRLIIHESPVFLKMKAERKTSKAPLTEAFGHWKNLKTVILALVGLTAGQAVIWYSGQFYALFFLTQALKVDGATANVLVAASLIIGTPFFIVFGSLSDRIGRKPIIMTGCFLAAVSYFPTFNALTQAANPALYAAQVANKITVNADPAECSFQFNPTGTSQFTSSCDIAKQALSARSVSYENAAAPAGTLAYISVGSVTVHSHDVARITPQDIEDARSAAAQRVQELKVAGNGAEELAAAEADLLAFSVDSKAATLSAKEVAFSAALTTALNAANYPTKADPAKMNKLTIVILLTYLVLLVTMVYGPIAAMLVEMFPTRIRYTSMSLPYHIGNGWFGGLLPTMAFAIVAQTGNMYSGLWYPILVAGMSFVVGTLFLKETKDVDLSTSD